MPAWVLLVASGALAYWISGKVRGAMTPQTQTGALKKPAKEPPPNGVYAGLVKWYGFDSTESVGAVIKKKERHLREDDED